jgi:sigma-B regulation protein RsbU (phosphoserine phosphatase)
MFTVDPRITVNQILQALVSDGIYFFLGAAFVTVGMVTAAVLFLRRRFDTLLVCLTLFATLDGIRLWLESESLTLLVGTSPFLGRIQGVLNYLVPIPAFFFIRACGFLSRPVIRIVYAATIFLLCLVLATILAGPLTIFETLNRITLSATLILMIAQSFYSGVRTKDLILLRRGLMLYTACALPGFIVGLLGFRLRLEPYGFAILLGFLGYVAGRRTFSREEKLDEIEKELDIAKRIQLSILPEDFPESACFQVAARYVPMTMVAGDFYEFLIAEDRRAGVLIADVSGHGIPAALISSMVKFAATSQRGHATDPAGLLSAMNTTLCGNTQGQFVTAAYVYLDAALGELCYSAAAHPPMLLLRNGEVTAIEKNGLMLAFFPEADYVTAVHPLKSGDRFLLYTDGIVEAFNLKADQFGQDNLCLLLRQTAHLSVSQTADRIISSIQEWSVHQADDLTVLVCDYVDRLDGQFERSDASITDPEEPH